MSIRADNPDRTPRTELILVSSHFRPKAFATTEGLPAPERGRLIPYLEDSTALHAAIIEGDGVPGFRDLEASTQAALLWASDLFLASAVDGGANRELAISVVVESLGHIASIIPQEGVRG